MSYDKKQFSQEIEHSSSFLANDVDYIVIETESANPIAIAMLDNSETPFKLQDGYRVRVGFKD